MKNDDHTKTAAVPEELLAFIRSKEKFLVAGHKEPDGDCVGSQLALCLILRRLGKTAIPCSAGPFKRTEIRSHEPLFVKKPSAAEREDAAVILVDCSTLDRAGDLESCIKGLPLAVIDHHETGDHSPSSAEAPVFLDGGAPSVTLLVQRLAEALGVELSKEEADYLLFGLCTDTGFFRHVDAAGAETFAAASRLVRAGSSPKDIFHRMHGGKSFNSRVLLGIILTRAEQYFDGKLILSWENYEETQRFGLEGRDSDSLYQLLQSIDGVQAIVIIRQETPENCTVGLRSRDSVDVAAVAAQFGGGGHKNAAGASIPGTIEALKPQFLEAFKKVF